MKKDTYLIYGVKRSGHHAILQWIAKNLDRRVLFYNDADEASFKKGAILHKGKYTTLAYNNDLSNTCDMYNIENGDLYTYEEVLHSPIVENHIKTIIVVRDIFNLIASTLKSTNDNVKRTVRERINFWKQYCKEMIGETNFLHYNDIVFVNYNAWFTSKGYRNAKAAEIGFVNKDKGINRVTPYGGGSSFDANLFKEEAYKMAVLQRYQHYIDDPVYLKYFKEDIQELNKKVFGFNLKDLQDGYNFTYDNS